MIKPAGHRLVVKPYKQAEVDDVFRKHKEILKDFQKREDLSVDKGIVLSIGPTAWQNESHGYTPWCKVGDEIVFAKFSGKEVEDPETGEYVFVLNDEDVVAVVKEAQ